MRLLENKLLNNQKGVIPILALVVTLVAIGIVGYFGYKQLSKGNTAAPTYKNTFNKNNKKTTQKVKVVPKVASSKPRSVAPGVITQVATAKSFNSNGSPVNPTSKFTTKNNQMYLIASLKGAKPGQKIEYVRYLNGKYVDHRSVTLSKNILGYVYFGWSTKPGKSFPIGIYRTRVYTDGVLEKRVNYMVQKDGSLSFVNP